MYAQGLCTCERLCTALQAIELAISSVSALFFCMFLSQKCAGICHYILTTAQRTEKEGNFATSF